MQIHNRNHLPAGGCKFEECQWSADDRVKHLYKAESEMIGHRRAELHTESCRCFELLNEHNTSIKMDPIQLDIEEDNDKMPYTQRNFTALLFSPFSRLASLQCFSAKVLKICSVCCKATISTKKANPVLDAASI
jgi:hypothetical protein